MKIFFNLNNGRYAPQVRASLEEFRGLGPAAGWGIVEHAACLRSAPLSSQVRNQQGGPCHCDQEIRIMCLDDCRLLFHPQLQLAFNVISGQDAMLSSWQFPIWDADFGAGGPLRWGCERPAFALRSCMILRACRYMCAIHPSPPWSAAVMPAHPSDGGLYLFLVVPSSARTALRSSPVLAELVPGATFA